MTEPVDLAALRKLERQATPGPWTRAKPEKDAEGWACGVAVAGTPGRQTIYANPPGGSFPSSDCDLIAAMRNALPALLDELERLRAAVDEMPRLIGELSVERDAVAAKCGELRDDRDRLLGVLQRIEGGDAPCQDEALLRQWAYDAITLDRSADELSESAP